MNTSTRTSGTMESRIRHLSPEVTVQRDRTEHTARRLSLIAIRNWEKGLTGMVALPAAVALTTGAGVLFALSILERTFEMFESTVADIGHRVGAEFDAHGDLRDGTRENGSQAS